MSTTKLLNDEIGVEGPSVEEIRESKPQKSIMLGVCKGITLVCEAVAVIGAAVPGLLPSVDVAGIGIGALMWGLVTHFVKAAQNGNAEKRQQQAFVEAIVQSKKKEVSLSELGRLAQCSDEQIKMLPMPLQVDVVEAQRDVLYFVAKEKGKLPEEIMEHIDPKKRVARNQDALSRLYIEREHIFEYNKESELLSSERGPIARGVGSVIAGFAMGFALGPQNDYGIPLLSAPMALSTLLLKNGSQGPAFEALPSIEDKLVKARKDIGKPTMRKQTAKPEPL